MQPRTFLTIIAISLIGYACGKNEDIIHGEIMGENISKVEYTIPGGKAVLIDHLSPVYSEQSEYSQVDKSLFIDINMVTFRYRVLSAIRN